ncbi:TPA: esterase [Enterobacter asburiae]|uniref:Esterase n=1 Tax=Enterobacter asburiae TaxID=61645 RepID=A0A7W3GT98_ENTAS|nr:MULTISPECIES: esterase [Enterobacter]EGQ5318265.1 esterase [Enterobacter asburiae]MBA7986015.1 esterase [Enterobacter asburiae]MBA8076060.1 esterase [Enterobacter asburiae]MEB2378812.1 esterase [Enterobacter sp. R-1.5.3]MEB2428538.1 esterase [Enterobacter sp. R-1.6.2]
MIEIEIRHLGDHEILHAMPAGKRDKPLPVVVFYHGFTSSKLVYSYFAVALAQAGFRVVMPDAPDHGARFTGNEQARLGQFWQILHGSLTEFAGLRDALYGAGLVADNRLAVAGASMGGMTALGIMTHHPEVKSVACLMGSGYFTSLAKTLFPPQDLTEMTATLAEWEVTRALPRVADRPLLLWHGDADDVVPPEGTFRLQQALMNEGLDANLTCLWEPGVRHRITPTALDATVAFFSQHL